ncbi:MAG: hypothetical protein IKP36_12100 [Bacteroidaceae bacterium]|nr:hypothetical protein [Bacteroidaceae bacterium]
MLILLCVQLQHQGLLMQSVDEAKGNAGIEIGGAGNGESRTKEHVNVWDEEW